MEMRNLERELALVKQQADTPSGDWTRYAVENTHLREKIALLERSSKPEVQAALEEDIKGLRQKCLELDEVRVHWCLLWIA